VPVTVRSPAGLSNPTKYVRLDNLSNLRPTVRMPDWLFAGWLQSGLLTAYLKRAITPALFSDICIRTICLHGNRTIPAALERVHASRRADMGSTLVARRAGK
jgi:hypothetical protein